MADHILKTLEDVKREVAALESQVAEKKRMANYLSGMAGGGDLYVIDESSDTGVMPRNGDEYYGMAAMTAIRMVLDARRSCNFGPATLAEIYDTLIAGGYQFDAASENNAKNSLRVTLAKRSSTFHKLPNGKYGLVKWYEKIKGGRKAPAKGGDADEDDQGLQAMQEEFGDGKSAEATATAEAK